MARCPAHSDNTASLSLNRGTNGTASTVLKCLAGCATEDVLAHVHLELRDLYENGSSSSKPKSSPTVKTYVYRDRNGQNCYRKHRTADKKFWFERYDAGRWVTGLGNIERHLYRRNELPGATEIFIVEGEKDADRVWSIGLPTTTNDGGAGKWTEAHTAQLKDESVTDVGILPDNDDAGRAHGFAIARSCFAAGMRVRVVNLPGLSEKEDVSDYLDQGHTLNDLLELYQSTALYTPPIAEPPANRVRVPRSLTDAHETFTRWLGKGYDTDALNAVLATAAAEQLDGDPLWLLLVSGSGNAKTETVQALAGQGAIITSTISSEGALLSATPKRESVKESTGGLLRRLGERGILVVKDVTSILSMQRDSRAGVLAALREVHDGRWERNVGTNGGRTLTWTGRIAVIGAVTTAWDTHHSVIATMGDRFVLIRVDSNVGRQSAGRHAIENTGHEIQMRQQLSDVIAGVLAVVNRRDPIVVSTEERDRLLDAANATTLSRTAVEYDYKGEPETAHAPEMPTRFAKQLTQLLRGAVAMGMDRNAAMRLAIRCARDSMPPLRLEILEDVAAHPGSQPSEVRQRLDKPWSTVKKQLQSLYLLGVLTCDEEEAAGAEGAPPKRRFLYSVNEETVTPGALALDPAEGDEPSSPEKSGDAELLLGLAEF
jgi:hypothetical protein